MRTIVLDSGAFVAAERRDRRLATFLAADKDATILIPAAVVAEIWRRSPRARSTALIESANGVVPLTHERAQDIGELHGTSSTLQIVDASVAALAIASAPSLVLSSDVHDIEALVKAAGVTCRIRATTASTEAVVIERI